MGTVICVREYCKYNNNENCNYECTNAEYSQKNLDCKDCVCNICPHTRCAKFKCGACDMKGKMIHKECINEEIQIIDRNGEDMY